MTNVALIVLMPSRGVLCVETAQALASNLDGFPTVQCTVSREPVDRARNMLAAMALEVAQRDPFSIGEDQYVCLWVDSDAHWPSGTVTKLLKALATTDYALVGGAFCRRMPFDTVAATLVDPARNNGAQVRANVGALQRVELLGFHFVAHGIGLLRQLGPNPFNLMGGSEDQAFCTRVREQRMMIGVVTDAFVAHIDERTGDAFLPSMPPGRIINGAFIATADDRPPSEIRRQYEKVLDIRSYSKGIDSTISRLRAESRLSSSVDRAFSGVAEHP